MEKRNNNKKKQMIYALLGVTELEIMVMGL